MIRQIAVRAAMAAKFTAGLNIATPLYSGVPAYTTALARSRQYVMGIQRLKNISTAVSLPSDVPLSAVSGVQITVDAEGLPPYVERFPFPTQQQ